MRILVVQTDQQWTGAIESQQFLSIPKKMDVKAMEDAWFAAGGDSSGQTFAQYLQSRGAKLLNPEIWTINYQ